MHGLNVTEKLARLKCGCVAASCPTLSLSALIVTCKESRGKFQENFGEISEILKMRKKFPRKISGKFPENSRKIRVFFMIKCDVTALKLLFLLLENV